LADYFTEVSLKERKVAAECTSLIWQMSMVSSSDCIASMTRSLANELADKLGLQIIPMPFSTFPIKYQLFVHNRDKKSPSNIWLREKLKSYLIEG
jgi:DNA-binding transcriptional LysR family regulator